jgi:hypothetical protein
MDNGSKRLVEFDRLNLLGKVVYVGGTVTRFLAGAIDGALSAAVDVVVEAERAFKQGLDPDVEDATILDEYSGDSKGEPGDEPGRPG